MKVAIIDCGAGNLHSVRKAFATQLPGAAVLEVVTEAAALRDATHLVLPGVGAFADCMAGLNRLPGMRDALEVKVLQGDTPFLGICVGMQMLFARGHEHGVHDGLGWFEGEVKKITPDDSSLRIPHMGWNRLRFSLTRSGRAGVGANTAQYENQPGAGEATLLPSPLQEERYDAHPFFTGIENGAFVYFVHSYAVRGCNRNEVLATVDYGGEIVSVIGRKNILATQFHPEKSQAVGLRLIHNFLDMGHGTRAGRNETA